jgi:hypothetical protein
MVRVMKEKFISSLQGAKRGILIVPWVRLNTRATTTLAILTKNIILFNR